MLGELLARRRRRRGARRRARAARPLRATGATRRSSSRGELRKPRAGGARGGDHRHLRAEPRAATRATRRARPLGGRRGRPSRAPARAAAAPGARRARPARARSSRGWRAASASSPPRQLGRDVEHVHEQARALDVGEEVVAEPGALARALDQAGDVGDHQLALLAFEHAQHRRERREGVVGDLRRGARQAREQRGLAGVRQAHEADVGEQLQLQLEPALLAGAGRARRSAAPGASAWRSACCPCRPRRRARPSRAGRPRAAPSGARRDPRRPRSAAAICVPGRHPDRERLAVGAVAQRALAVAAAPGPVVGLAPERLQVAQRVVAHEHDVAAAPAVAAVGPAARHVRFAAEARAAVAAGAGLHVDPRAVVEHRSHRDSRGAARPGARRPA